MKNAIWFSRHQPTAGQIEDAASVGCAITVTPEGLALGAMDLRDNGDVLAVVTALLAHAAEQNAAAIFGVFAAPILAQIARTSEDATLRGGARSSDVPCFASWNVQRAAEGGKPTFEHRSWIFVGRLSKQSCRWL